MITDIIHAAVFFGLAYTVFLMVVTTVEMRKKVLYLVQEHELPPVSILKPLKGIDDQLEQNLRSFFTLDSPRFELLFGVNDPDDPAIDLVKRIQKKYPEVDSKLIIDSRQVGLNPKINNLNNLYPLSTYQHLLISDSNVRVNNLYLKEMMGEYLKPNVGLVTSVFRGSQGKSFGAHLENLHLNTYIGPNVFAIKRLIGKSITIGKSMLFSKEMIKKIKGFSALSDFLAEDHMLGVYVKKAGFEIRNSTHIIDNVNVNWPLERFLNRHLRWAKMRRTLNLFHYLAEPLSNPVFIALIGLIGRPDLISVYTFLLASALKTIIDVITARQLEADSKWYHYLLIPFKDILIGFVWLVPFVDRKISWRGNWFKISKGTRLYPITG